MQRIATPCFFWLREQTIVVLEQCLHHQVGSSGTKKDEKQNMMIIKKHGSPIKILTL